VVLRCLAALQAEGVLEVVRVKNRFKNPTAGGWADALINFVLLRRRMRKTTATGEGGREQEEEEDQQQQQQQPQEVYHICELQLVHSEMLKARKEFGGHTAYAAFREAAELLAFGVRSLAILAVLATLLLHYSTTLYYPTCCKP
jgi:hypothetical protein